MLFIRQDSKSHVVDRTYELMALGLLLAATGLTLTILTELCIETEQTKNADFGVFCSPMILWVGELLTVFGAAFLGATISVILSRR